jgi:hypothetical protein
LDGRELQVPQFTFLYDMGGAMRVHRFMKEIAFRPDMLKGYYDPETTQLYPYGHRWFMDRSGSIDG